MINALIIDDEAHCIDSLLILINKYCPNVSVLSSCPDGECGLESIEEYQPDLVFLDVAMPKMNGFDMLSKLEKIDFEIIFTTAFDNFAIKAFKVCAVDYLLKPVDRQELVNAVAIAEERINLRKQKTGNGSNLEQFTMLLENLKQNQEAFPNIAIPTLEGFELVRVKDILYITGDSNYANVYIKNRSPLLVSKTIKYLEDRIKGHNFFRIHHSNLINLSEVTKYVKGLGGYVIMSDGKQLNVSRSKKNELMKFLNA
jgi:two-component system, LytTR family, response regulator